MAINLLTITTILQERPVMASNPLTVGHAGRVRHHGQGHRSIFTLLPLFLLLTIFPIFPLLHCFTTQIGLIQHELKPRNTQQQKSPTTMAKAIGD